MFDLISIGDCTIDHLFKIHEAHVSCNIDKSKCELCLNYASKIASENYSELVAGNGANNAVGVSRLGLKTAYYVNVGDDDSGEKIIHKLKDENVDTRYVVKNSHMHSNSSAVINFHSERTIFVYHQPWNYMLPDLNITKWVYFTSMSSSFSKTSIVPQLQQYLERTRAKLGFNPGTYQLEYGVRKYPRLLSLVTVLFVNVQEAKIILGQANETKFDIKKLLMDLHDLGPEYIIITNGGEGSYGFDGKSFYKLGVFPAKLVEMTGAGDAYATGVIAGLFYGKQLKEAMRWGAANSASVVEQVGSQAGLLSFSQMQERLKKTAKFTSKKF